MAVQTIIARYVDQNRLVAVLAELFGIDKFQIEVCHIPMPSYPSLPY